MTTRRGWSEQQNRVGWLLRVNRLYGPDEHWQRESAFAGAFQGGCWPEHTTVYRISRWETAAVRAPYRAVRRYEELLQLPRNQLVALIDGIYRYCAPTVGSAPLLAREPAAGGRLDELVEAARADEVMTGSDWDLLTGCLAATPRQVITPRSAWSDIAERLLTEMIVANGVAWIQRYEALNRLLAHPVGQQAAVAACASLAADRTNQVFVETVSVLDGSPHPDASRHVLEQLSRPTNDRAQYGALLACVRKVRYGHFSQSQLRRLVPIVNELALDSARYEDTQPLAAELLRRIPADVSAAATYRLRQAAVGGARPAQRTGTGRRDLTDVAQIVVARVTNTTVATMSREVPHFRDGLLPVLVDEMLFSPVLDVRLYATMLLLGTPYRGPLAATLAGELTTRAANRLGDEARTIVEALRILGGPEQRPVIERLTTAAGLPPALTVVATSAIGHLDGSSDDRYWTGAVNHHARLWDRTRDEASASALTGLIYGLGLARNTGLLRRIRDDDATPAAARAAAAWWLNLPRSVCESAGR